MKQPKWCGCLLAMVVSSLLMPVNLAAHSSSFPLLTPDLVEEYNHRGVAKFELGDNQGAILDYNRAIKIDPQDALAYYNRGVAKFELGDNQGAILDFDRAIAINPQDAEAYSNRGAVKLAFGDKQGAIVDLTKGAKLFRQQGKMADYEKIVELIRQSI
jgi:tetratricopeptide (TPR) repeat protein